MGDMMERIEKIVNEHNAKDKNAASSGTVEESLLKQPLPPSQLPEEGKGNKYAGFFI